jgi:uncharacterized protein
MHPIRVHSRAIVFMATRGIGSFMATWKSYQAALLLSMDEPLPTFRYHPDPVKSKSVKVSSVACVVCEQARGYIYTGPVYADEEYEEVICPWCIADGTAADQLEAEFTDVGSGVPEDVPDSVRDAVARRTPGFESWQQDRWLYHCGDGCAFLGRLGREDLGNYPKAIESLLAESRKSGCTEDEAAQFVESLSADGDASGYLFRCLVCGIHLAFADST